MESCGPGRCPAGRPQAAGSERTGRHDHRAQVRQGGLDSKQPGQQYAAHFWVQRPAGWRLLHTNEIATRPAVPGENVRPDFTIPCINPCKELPYKPLSPSEKAALENWQDQESGTGHHDMHMGDNTVVISSTTQTPRKSATATGPTPVRPPTADRPFISTTPALYARTWDFGDSVVMIMLQPTWGGKADLVEPCVRQPRQRPLEDGRELPQHDPGIAAHDRGGAAEGHQLALTVYPGIAHAEWFECAIPKSSKVIPIIRLKRDYLPRVRADLTSCSRIDWYTCCARHRADGGIAIRRRTNCSIL